LKEAEKKWGELKSHVTFEKTEKWFRLSYLDFEILEIFFLSSTTPSSFDFLLESFGNLGFLKSEV